MATRSASALLAIAALLTGIRPAAAGPQSTARLAGVACETPRWSYLLPDKVEAAKRIRAASARIGGTEVLFFDVDGNGRFGDAGIDGWSLPGQKYMVPLEDPIVLGGDEVKLAFKEDGVVQYAVKPIAGTPLQIEALKRLNSMRLTNGLEPASLDAALSRACDLHCGYMVRNGVSHFEEPGRPGYSRDGAVAGMRSCLACRCTLRVAADEFYETFYHRLPLMSPDLRAFGIGFAIGFSAIDGKSRRTRRPWRWPVAIPAPDAEAQPIEFPFAREDPLPYQGTIVPGFPVTLEFPSSSIAAVDAELREGGPKGRLIDAFVSWPEKPANAMVPDNACAICILPRKLLHPKTAYFVRAAYTFKGEKAALSWSFKTSNGLKTEHGGY